MLEGNLFVIVLSVRREPALPAARDRDHWKPPFSLAGPARLGRAELFLPGDLPAARSRYSARDREQERETIWRT